MNIKTLAAIVLATSFVVPAASAKPVKIGMITTLSGGGASLGIDTRDGFELAVKLKGGKLGGVDTEIIVSDDARKVETAKQIASRMLKKDDVDIVTGIVWSNLALAVVPGVTRAGKFYLSTNAAPSKLAGKGCDPNYFSVAYQNDNLDEAAGQYATDAGYKKAYLIAPNYPAGKDHLAGFKRLYKGEIVGEVYTKLGQPDYSAELANLRAAAPDVVYIFLPGGMGVNFIKQYSQAGLLKSIPLVGPAFSFDEGILSAVGDAAIGMYNTSQWSPDIPTEANKEFVAEFTKTYGRAPSLYAAQGYDTALLIDAAVAAVGGDMSKTDAFRAALKKADFATVREPFTFGPNNHPIQDFYLREVVKVGDHVTNKIVKKVLSQHKDVYAPLCKM